MRRYFLAVLVVQVIILTGCDNLYNDGLVSSEMEPSNTEQDIEVVTIASIPGITPPAYDETPVTTITETDQYTGTVSWSPDDNYFYSSTVYTATISLTAKPGYTLNGVFADFFTVAGADSVSNDADSGVVTAVFPVTGEAVYSVTYAANGGTTGSAPTDGTSYNSGDVVTVLDNTGNLVGAEVNGEHAGSGIRQRFIGWSTDPGATSAEYEADDTFSITENTTLYAIYTTGTDVLRKVGPAGGWVFYDYGSTESWGRYLEAWNEDEGQFEWKSSLTETSGTATGIGMGYNNTYNCMTGSEHPAAEVVRGVTYGGYSDWFLPSRDELIEMDANLKDYGVGNFKLEGVAYWSSSEYNFEHAWLMDFRDGHGIGYTFKTDPTGRDVRAVRAFY